MSALPFSAPLDDHLEWLLSSRIVGWALRTEAVQAELLAYLEELGPQGLAGRGSLGLETIGRVIMGVQDDAGARWIQFNGPTESPVYKAVNAVIASDPFAAALLPKGLLKTNCFGDIGQLVMETLWWRENATECRRAAKQSKTVREIMDR